MRLATKKVGGEQVAVKSISKAKLVCKEDVQDVKTEVRRSCTLQLSSECWQPVAGTVDDRHGLTWHLLLQVAIMNLVAGHCNVVTLKVRAWAAECNDSWVLSWHSAML